MDIKALEGLQADLDAQRKRKMANMAFIDFNIYEELLQLARVGLGEPRRVTPPDDAILERPKERRIPERFRDHFSPETRALLERTDRIDERRR